MFVTLSFKFIVPNILAERFVKIISFFRLINFKMTEAAGAQKNTAYGVFVQACWAQHKRQYPDELIHKEIEEFNKQCSVWWYNLSEQERDRFQVFEILHTGAIPLGISSESCYCTTVYLCTISPRRWPTGATPSRLSTPATVTT